MNSLGQLASRWPSYIDSSWEQQSETPSVAVSELIATIDQHLAKLERARSRAASEEQLPPSVLGAATLEGMDGMVDLVDIMRGELVDLGQERTAVSRHLEGINTLLSQQLGTAPDTTLMTTDQIQQRLQALNEAAARCSGR